MGRLEGKQCKGSWSRVSRVATKILPSVGLWTLNITLSLCAAAEHYTQAACKLQIVWNGCFSNVRTADLTLLVTPLSVSQVWVYFLLWSYVHCGGWLRMSGCLIANAGLKDIDTPCNCWLDSWSPSGSFWVELQSRAQFCRLCWQRELEGGV